MFRFVSTIQLVHTFNTKYSTNIYFILLIYSFFNVDNYRTNTVYNLKNSNKMLNDVNTLVKKPIEHNTFDKKGNKRK